LGVLARVCSGSEPRKGKPGCHRATHEEGRLRPCHSARRLQQVVYLAATDTVRQALNLLRRVAHVLRDLRRLTLQFGRSAADRPCEGLIPSTPGCFCCSALLDSSSPTSDAKDDAWARARAALRAVSMTSAPSDATASAVSRAAASVSEARSCSPGCSGMSVCSGETRGLPKPVSRGAFVISARRSIDLGST
jgi:hypothetical protein